MQNFNDCFLTLMGNEGKYVVDDGGPTMWGITQSVATANGYTGPMKMLPLATAQVIAKREYWDKFQCDQFDIRIGFQVFDAAYNGAHPAQWLQQAAGLVVDGIIGPETIHAINSMNPLCVILK